MFPFFININRSGDKIKNRDITYRSDSGITKVKKAALLKPAKPIIVCIKKPVKNPDCKQSSIVSILQKYSLILKFLHGQSNVVH
jgi:hypothetical protein